MVSVPKFDRDKDTIMKAKEAAEDNKHVSGSRSSATSRPLIMERRVMEGVKSLEAEYDEWRWKKLTLDEANHIQLTEEKADLVEMDQAMLQVPGLDEEEDLEGDGGSESGEEDDEEETILVEDVSTGTTKVMEKSELAGVIMAVHKHIGHAGIEKTLLEMKKHVRVTNLKKIVKDVLKECTTCATQKDKKEEPLEPLERDEDGEVMMNKRYDAWKCTVIRLNVSDEVRKALDLLSEEERNDFKAVKTFLRKQYKAEPHIETVRVMKISYGCSRPQGSRRVS
jgi:hypothetical protein